MYLWHLNSRDESELINRVYTTQKISSSVGDWVKLVQADKSELGITLTDEEIRLNTPKHNFWTAMMLRLQIIW